jgi:hypothetical protein
LISSIVVTAKLKVPCDKVAVWAKRTQSLSLCKKTLHHVTILESNSLERV